MNIGSTQAGAGASGQPFNLAGPLGVSLAAVAVGVIVAAWGFVAITSSLFGRGVGDVQPDKELESLIAAHQEDIKTWQDRFNGRSAFFKPPAPYRPPPPPPPPPPDEKPFEEPKPTIDPVYRGPSISFAYADVVYFNPASATDPVKFLRIRVGEEKSGVKVVSVSLPWSVKVAYRGGEYDVPIFNRTDSSTFLLTTARSNSPNSFLVPVGGQTVAVPLPSAPGSVEPTAAMVPPDDPDSSAVQQAEAAGAATQPAADREPLPPRDSRRGRPSRQETPRPNPPQPEPEPTGEKGGVREDPQSDDTEPQPDDTGEEVPVDDGGEPAPEPAPEPPPEKQPKIAALSHSINSIQMADNSSTPATGRSAFVGVFLT